MKLPPELEHIIEREFEHKSLRKVAGAVRKLRENYRILGNNATTDVEDLKAYVAYRMPGTFAAITHVLTELKSRHPVWSPNSLLDIGSGPGTTLWAALEIWPSIKRATLVEQNSTMVDLGKKLAKQASQLALRNALWRQLDIRKDQSIEKSELVVISYVLGELPEGAREQVVKECWARTSHSICIIEPAKSPRGSDIIGQVSNYLLKLGADILAPWPDPSVFRSSDNRWLHFAERVERSHLQRLVKGTFRSYEDEKFAYVIASRHSGIPYAARVTLQPKIGTGHIRVELCTDDGINQIIVTKKRNPEAYKIARKLKWGDTVDKESPLLLLQ